MASRNIGKNRKGEGGWSSDEDYQGSRGSEEDWRSDNDWNEDSSIAGEASVMSEATEEGHPEDEAEEMRRKEKTKKPLNAKMNKLNLDDVGTEDDGESRHPEDITERTDGNYSKTNASDLSDISDIEDRITETQNKFMDDKQELSGVMGLVDEVTIKGENLTRKASETSLVVEKDTFKRGALPNDQLSLFDDDEISFQLYTNRTLEEDHIPQRDVGKKTTGRIEYINYGEKEEQNVSKHTFGLGHIEYLDEDKSEDSGSLISEQVDSFARKKTRDFTKDSKEDGKSENSCKMNITNEEQPLQEKLDQQSDSISLTSGESHCTAKKSEKLSLKSTKSSIAASISIISNETEAEDSVKDLNDDDDCSNEETCPLEKEYEIQDESPDTKEFEDPECSRHGEKHLCCFINIGGGGDNGRENELVNRLKKLKDDISHMRKELSLARQECKKESEEVAKLIEAAAARNRAAEQNEVALTDSSSNILPKFNAANYAMEEVLPSPLISQVTALPGRTQVAIPTSLLADRIRTTRQTASSNYRESLHELERMVEKEMASIKDSMNRLEPLNKMAAEWDAVLPLRDPKRTTFKRDYRLEMVTSEMRLQAPDVKNVTMQEIM